MYYVRIDHLSESDLALMGFIKIDENEEFVVFRHYTGVHHLLPKSGMKFLYVEDLNDAVAMSATDIVQLPTAPPR